MESTKKHPEPVVLRPNAEARDAALRIISHLHTAAWGVVDLRRSIARALPEDEGLAGACEALLDVLSEADAEASHAYNHGLLGACPQGFWAHPMRNTNPNGRPFRMDRDSAGPQSPAQTGSDPSGTADSLF